MKVETIRTMKPGRGMDRALSRALGLDGPLHDKDGPWSPSTDRALAVGILAHQCAGQTWHVQWHASLKKYECVVCADQYGYAAGAWLGEGDTLPEAITRALLMRKHTEAMP